MHLPLHDLWKAMLSWYYGPSNPWRPAVPAVAAMLSGQAAVAGGTGADALIPPLCAKAAVLQHLLPQRRPRQGVAAQGI